MAQETLGQVPDLNLREAEEIERLIKEEEEKAADKIRRAHPLKKFLNRKLFTGLGSRLGNTEFNETRSRCIIGFYGEPDTDSTFHSL
jgi:hypothetical protein